MEPRLFGVSVKAVTAVVRKLLVACDGYEVVKEGWYGLCSKQWWWFALCNSLSREKMSQSIGETS